MKFTWKKFASVAMVTSLLTLTACADKEEGGESTKGGEKSAGTLEIGVEAGYIDYVNSIVPAFEEETGIDVTVTERDLFETLEALPLDGPAGIAPDVMIAPYDRVGNLGQQGHLAEYAFPDDGRFDDLDKQQVTIDGKIYGAPFVIESLILYYNKDLIDKAPATFAELEALTEDERFAFESEKGRSTAFLANWLDFYSTYGLLSAYGGYVFGENGTNPSEIGLNNEGAIEGIKYATEWFGKWPQGMLDSTTAGSFIDEQFTSGKAAAIIGGPWSASNYKEAGVNYGVSMIPTLPNGEEYQPFAGGKAWIASNYAKDKEAANKWLDFVTNEANQQKLYEAKGEVPANQMTRKTVAEAGDELTTAVINQYNNAIPMPNIPQMAEVWTGAATLMFDAASGNKTPEQSANDAVDVISENIDQKY
ncbi:extracellular solute-binding protein [Robertmurraya yapensis]|uniref:Maltodextrin-binding protein n=2 Tax=Bacillaceae TaxID=186817 RepID=A0A3S0JRS3_9BACI|nr:extracellular solute-binding protein [Bacillus yapensis]RTR27567.1 extracellular solute-binding protein [Bacillus yapensis]TKS94135.1 extracellular solute-binding protein [Bacillus yapensis]